LATRAAAAGRSRAEGRDVGGKKCETSISCAREVGSWHQASPAERPAPRARDDRRDRRLQRRNAAPVTAIERHCCCASARCGSGAPASPALRRRRSTELWTSIVVSSTLWPRSPFPSGLFDLIGFGVRIPARAAKGGTLPTTSSSKSRRSKRNDFPNSKAAGSGAPSKRPDQRVVILSWSARTAISCRRHGSRP
jgi:hypothetical protein